MPWIILIVAGLFETGWAVGLKYTDGFSKAFPTAATAGAMFVSVVLLGIALRDIPLGTGYAVWTGIGTIGTVVFGILFFAEPASVAHLACIGLILAGIIGLKLVSGA